MYGVKSIEREREQRAVLFYQSKKSSESELMRVVFREEC